MEIERKFLVKHLPAGWRRQPHSAIMQGYFPLKTKKTEIRLRRKDHDHFITIKAGLGRARKEEEIRIPGEQFAALWPLTRECISKTRYRLPFKGHTIEMDVYDGRHRGLITADVEFKSRKEAAGFRPPEWFDREITGNRRYANEKLARE
jgi:CYTH domain-containing protein